MSSLIISPRVRNKMRLLGCDGGYEEEWEYDCGIILACDKGDDDSQIEWEDYE